MIQRMLTSALFAGAAAGLIAALLHFAFVQNLILLGEEYETGALTHFAQGGGMGHDHGTAAPETAATDAAAPETAAGEGHSHAPGTPEHSHDAEAHSHGEAAPLFGMSRNPLTVLFTVLIYVSYAAFLVAGFGLAETQGARIGKVEGLLWGLGGFAAFQLIPAVGLEPELPGTVAAELAARQTWWWGTAIATAAGLGLLAYGKSPVLWLVAIALLAAPHVIGAPKVDGFAGVAPPEVASAFAARVLAVGFVVWGAMGWVAGYLWSRPQAQ